MHNIDIYPVIIQSKGYAPGLALGRRGVSKVSDGRLRNVLLHEDLLLVLFDDFIVLLLAEGHDLQWRVLYMHAVMMMQCLVIQQQQLLK